MYLIFCCKIMWDSQPNLINLLKSSYCLWVYVILYHYLLTCLVTKQSGSEFYLSHWSNVPSALLCSRNPQRFSIGTIVQFRKCLDVVYNLGKEIIQTYAIRNPAWPSLVYHRFTLFFLFMWLKSWQETSIEDLKF